MSNFKAGEKVVCVEPIYNLVKNKDYEIKGLFDFGCGEILLDVGVSNGFESEFSRCRCGVLHRVKNVYSANRFRKLDTQFAEDVCGMLIEEHNSNLIPN